MFVEGKPFFQWSIVGQVMHFFPACIVNKKLDMFYGKKKLIKLEENVFLGELKEIGSWKVTDLPLCIALQSLELHRCYSHH